MGKKKNERGRVTVVKIGSKVQREPCPRYFAMKNKTFSEPKAENEPKSEQSPFPSPISLFHSAKGKKVGVSHRTCLTCPSHGSLEHLLELRGAALTPSLLLAKSLKEIHVETPLLCCFLESFAHRNRWLVSECVKNSTEKTANFSRIRLFSYLLPLQRRPFVVDFSLDYLDLIYVIR